MMNHKKPTWAPKVNPNKIRRLYQQDAKGILDDELLDDVGYSLYARCDSMLMVSYANLGHPLCILCRTEMPHSYEKDFVTVCPKCGWTITIGEYKSSYKGQTLNGVGALPALKNYVEKFPRAKIAAEKMRLIDALLHSFHGELSEEPSRPTAVNVIDANIGQVANLIYTLAYGENSTASREALEVWLEKFNRSISRNIDPKTGTLKPNVSYLYEGIGKKAKKKQAKNKQTKR